MEDFGRNGSTLCSLSQCILGSVDFQRCWSAPMWLKVGSETEWALRLAGSSTTTSCNKINRVTKRSHGSERIYTGLVFKHSFFCPVCLHLNSTHFNTHPLHTNGTTRIHSATHIQTLTGVQAHPRRSRHVYQSQNKNIMMDFDSILNTVSQENPDQCTSFQNYHVFLFRFT